jgi:hypothetical protein
MPTNNQLALIAGLKDSMSIPNIGTDALQFFAARTAGNPAMEQTKTVGTVATALHNANATANSFNFLEVANQSSATITLYTGSTTIGTLLPASVVNPCMFPVGAGITIMASATTTAAFVYSTFITGEANT